ncbi:MAG: HEPN domain-containing protein [Nanoarchaeota archaeon]|nr:HEPN domain-containing protein [Nanoarchaeota archaeon]MBU1322251.1 HEPN domain-containing protein [Nanoarchaeota archaeon]MBU1598231.1 HEPN domain-containing protein [Nanoarchaeota archaeon]MBU2441984.1 HEPN domain-containing protein [Nanoarchaeota archaeon]
MQDKKLSWCFGIKDGLRIVEPNKRLSDLYLKEAKSSLKRAEKDFEDNDLLWSTVVIYYADYYALYSFLQKIGVNCEIHSCSISAVGFLLGDDKINVVNQHKEKRIDAQYYIKIGKEAQVKQILKEAKLFVSLFDEIVSNITNNEIEKYRSELKKIALKKKFKELSEEIQKKFRKHKISKNDLDQAIKNARKK